MCSIDKSHIGVAWKVIWLMSKSGAEFLSAGADGRVMIWDMRKLNETLETFIIDPKKQASMDKTECIFDVDYDFAIPSKFMVATDRGNAYVCNR